jgi:hypothetical protein
VLDGDGRPIGKLQLERMRKKEAEAAAHKARMKKLKEDRKKRQANLLMGKKRFGARDATTGFMA